MLGAKRIAIVGLSDDPGKASFGVGQYLQQHGYEIVPINPNVPQVLGVRALPSLAALDRPPDVTLVFRRSEHCAEVTREAIQAGTKGVWLQSGIRNEQAKDLARQAGIDFVQDRCMMVTHMRQKR
jgi:predicted CoA-binding protein